MKTILTMPDTDIALLTMEGEGSPFILNRRTMAEMNTLLDEVERCAPRALVLTGTGKFFCAGADIKEMAAMSGQELYEWAPLGSRLNTRLEELSMPVIAAVNGMALGGGCELALACDLRCASMAASFAVPEVSLGTICGAGGTQRLPRLIGETRAKEMIFTGRRITAETAREWGLVNNVFTAGTLLEETLELAREIAQNSPFAVCRAKRSVNGGREMMTEEAMEWERSLFGECGGSRDRKEGMTAFLEKRPRIFTGE